MKNLTLIVHADIQRSLADVLHSLEQVTGFTFTQVEGHGPQAEYDSALSARDLVIGYTPHVRVDILLKDEDVEAVLQALRDADCGLAGRGIFQVTAVELQGAL
ncbi:MAG: P-II family nitrogen regulator [Gammaproteobacteria bacterium]|jgi:nitrogen regulatory protein P-II 1|nr:P-II family nitrogen regulator [Gammaproteobacteria bacterium]MBU4045217.1 P-II family nitrogen regulator [Gammaproteobacteria bacterium]MBU4151077.1 P-II family nitrogen regulator [Gammaproteobacteria bacterium]